MTLPILHRTVREADPRRNYRLRDFLSTLGLHPVFVPDPGPVAAIEAAPAAEAEAPAAARPPVCTNCGEPAEPCTQKPCVEGCDGSVHTSGGRHGCEGGGGFAAVASPLAPPVPYGHPSIADAVAAKDGPAEADAAPDAEAAK